ncbi:serine/threonine-protein kinase [Aquirufa sp. HETE-83D]|uniref:Serine/threonine-protein kinase n=1 Tax=Aquirufa esocilacus TaxID=3096513 RepID=A0ABW6DEH2_9BACT
MSDKLIGKYKIIRLIGEGGMASVYEAIHIVLRNKVAIKILSPILSGNAQIRERFRNEARLMASLDHPNIAKVIDFDEQPQRLSIIMEFLNGVNLNDKIKLNGPLSQKEVIDVFIQSLSALQYAHDHGIVHRDINPSNIFILSNGQVKILDFGIAKLYSQGVGVTQTGTQLGTPIYMSPEQVKGDKSIDYRSDIYSLGVSMFYAINGKSPYSPADSVFNTYTKIVNEPLPEFTLNSIFKNVVMKACHKRKEDRYYNCLDLAHALQLAAESGSRFTSKTFMDRLISFKPSVSNKLLAKSVSDNKQLINSNIFSLNFFFKISAIVGGGVFILVLLNNIYEIANKQFLSETNNNNSADSSTINPPLTSRSNNNDYSDKQIKRKSKKSKLEELEREEKFTNRKEDNGTQKDYINKKQPNEASRPNRTANKLASPKKRKDYSGSNLVRPKPTNMKGKKKSYNNEEEPYIIY